MRVQIEIEQRPAEEMTHFKGQRVVTENITVRDVLVFIHKSEAVKKGNAETIQVTYSERTSQGVEHSHNCT